MRGQGSEETVEHRAAVIVNPVKVDVARLRSAVTAEEKAGGWRPSAWFETSRDDPGQTAARSALEQDPAVVIVAGGDGTVRAVAEVLQSSGTPVAIVAAGTGNLLSRNLGLMDGIDTAVRTAFTGADHPIDVGVAELTDAEGQVTTDVFLVMTGVGLDARMATDTNSVLKKRIGWLAYTDPISRSVFGNKQFSMHFRVGAAKERSVDAHTVIVGNCGTLTAGILLLPDARLDDGLLDVVLLRPKGFWQWLRVGTRLGIGGLLHRTKGGRVALRATPDLRALRYVRARTLNARFDEPQSIELDGDSFGLVSAVAITLRPGALIVRVRER
ncbi:diacylglycerol/lipid kinase family protein [Ruania halotolerans]|uniref:diacylglycerol/lipid kinase family protein n=1 Tax=Ruania halotolerans TaxID=2897773 RepID=UPI001E4287C9|nr:diacylglycerol kinase family protein [Ruania halotolerans]UFU05383.1 NAD(+)/NADH kinase [Ruania halotolerans]